MKLHTIQYSEPPDSETLSEREIHEQIDTLVSTRAREATISAIFKKKKVLVEFGALTDSYDATLHQQILADFRALAELPSSAVESERQMCRGKVLDWMRLAGTLRINSLSDWSVSREHPEERLGIQSFRSLEGLLAKKYSEKHCVHFHQGSGNNQIVHNANNDTAQASIVGTAPEQSPHNKIWRQVGLGDKLYAPIRPIQERFLRKNPDDTQSTRHLHNTLIDILTEALQRKLHARWFSAGTTIGETWKETGATQDLNAIFDLLADPKALLEGVHTTGGPNNSQDLTTGALSVSRQFQADTERRIEKFHQWKDTCTAVHRWLLGYQGMSNKEVELKLAQLLRTGLKRHIQFITDEQLRLLKENDLDVVSDADREQMADGAITLSFVRTYGDAIKKLETVKIELDAELNALVLLCQKPGSSIHPGLVEHVQKKVEIRIPDGTTPEEAAYLIAEKFQFTLPNPRAKNIHPTDLLRQLFSDKFTFNVIATASERNLDLNKNLPDAAFPEGFILANFDEIGKIFPPSSCMLISGIRSHSHAPDAAFIKTVETNLQLLKPGGVFITDGIEESYTEVLRLIASLDGYKVDIIMDEKTHMPISLMIQRKPASGECLTEDEKRQICKKNTYCKNPEDIANLRPDIAIITRVRQELRATLPVSVFRRVNSEHHLSLTQKPETAKELQKSLMRAVAEKELLTHQEWLTPEFAEYLCGRLKERLGLKGLTVSLKPLLPADLQFFAQQGVSTIAARLRKNITFLGASICAEDPIVHEQSKRSVVDAIAWAQWQTSHPKNPEDENTSCQAIKTTFLHTARNISYTENPILKAEDIERIAKATTQNLRETLARSQHQTR